MAERTTLQPCTLFHTPKDMDELIERINVHPECDRVYLLTAAMMAWNLAAKLTSEEVIDEN